MNRINYWSDELAAWIAWRIESWAVTLNDAKLNPIIREDLLKGRAR